MLRRLLVLSASLISLASRPPSRHRSSVGGHVTRLTRPRSTSTTKPAENTAVPKSAHSNNAWRCASSRCETTFRIVRSSIRKTLSGPAGSFRKAFERALTQQTFRGDVPVLYFGRERRLNPDGFGLLNRFGQFGFWAHHGIELFPDLTGNRPRPARPNPAHVDQFFAFPLPEVELRLANATS